MNQNINTKNSANNELSHVTQPEGKLKGNSSFCQLSLGVYNTQGTKQYLH